MNESKDEMNGLLKSFESFLENIHDNYASIKNLERQKKIADDGAAQAIDKQIEDINKILMNNQRKASEMIEKVIKISETASLNVKEGCKKLKSDFENDRTNPNLLVIQKDISEIKKAI